MSFFTKVFKRDLDKTIARKLGVSGRDHVAELEAIRAKGRDAFSVPSIERVKEIQSDYSRNAITTDKLNRMVFTDTLITTGVYGGAIGGIAYGVGSDNSVAIGGVGGGILGAAAGRRSFKLANKFAATSDLLTDGVYGINRKSSRHNTFAGGGAIHSISSAQDVFARDTEFADMSHSMFRKGLNNLNGYDISSDFLTHKTPEARNAAYRMIKHKDPDVLFGQGVDFFADSMTSPEVLHRMESVRVMENLGFNKLGLTHVGRMGTDGTEKFANLTSPIDRKKGFPTAMRDQTGTEIGGALNPHLDVSPKQVTGQLSSGVHTTFDDYSGHITNNSNNGLRKAVRASLRYKSMMEDYGQQLAAPGLTDVQKADITARMSRSRDRYVKVFDSYKNQQTGVQFSQDHINHQIMNNPLYQHYGLEKQNKLEVLQRIMGG